jgi:hypothetical protein
VAGGAIDEASGKATAFEKDARRGAERRRLSGQGRRRSRSRGGQWWIVVILTILVIYVTMVYGPIAAMLVELFPTRIRYTSMSLPYHIGNGWFGGLLPATAFAIVAARPATCTTACGTRSSSPPARSSSACCSCEETKDVDIDANDDTRVLTSGGPRRPARRLSGEHTPCGKSSWPSSPSLALGPLRPDEGRRQHRHERREAQRGDARSRGLRARRGGLGSRAGRGRIGRRACVSRLALRPLAPHEPRAWPGLSLPALGPGPGFPIAALSRPGVACRARPWPAG